MFNIDFRAMLAQGRSCALLLVLCLSGCATFENGKVIPTQAKPLSIAVLDEDISAWSDMPIGAYRIPESQVVISGHQQKAGVGMLLFGVVGVALAHAGDSSAGAANVKDTERVLKMRVTAPVDEALRRQLADGRYAAKINAAPGARAASLQVVPTYVLTKVSEQDYLPFLVLKVALPDGSGNSSPSAKPAWSTRYISALGKPRPLAGTGSWTENEGAALKEALRVNADRATSVLVEDIASPMPRGQGELTLVQGNYAFANARLQTTGHLLKDDEASIIYIPKLGDIIVFTGVNILDKANVVYRPATKDDAPFKLIEADEGKKK